MLRKKFKGVIGLYGYLAPTIIGLILFNAGTIVVSFILSFYKYDVITPPTWIGLENYRWVLNSSLFWKSVKNTFAFASGYIPLSIAISLALAILVNQKIKGVGIFRTVFYLPVVTSMVGVSIVFAWLFNPYYGLVNYVLGLFKITGPAWLSSTQWAMPAVIIVSVWKTAGYYMVIYLAALQNVSPNCMKLLRSMAPLAGSRFATSRFPLYQALRSLLPLCVPCHH